VGHTVRTQTGSEVLEFEYVDCACPPGTEETPACNYGRSCGILKAGGKELGDILIAEGLAVPSSAAPPGARKLRSLGARQALLTFDN
jgi:hypothetical protein